MEEVPFDVNNNNNVPPKDKEEADEEIEVQDPANAQARAFHRRLVELHPEWFGNNVQSYYKTIDPITSTPQRAGSNEWRPYSVSIGGRRIIMENEQDTCTHDGISFNPNFNPNAWKNFDPNEPITIPISYNNKPDEEPIYVQFMQFSINKTPVLTRIENYNGCVASARGNRFSLRHKITLRGELDGEEGPDLMIEIEAENDQLEAIILQGMELIFNKDTRTTQILFDFVDTAHEPVDLMPPIECRHSNGVVDDTLFYIKKKQVYKDVPIYSFFDSPETRRRWVPDELNFYDQNNQCLVSLPSSYASANDPHAIPADPIAWVLGEGNNSLYRCVQELEMQNDNKYICCDNGLFYALLPYTAICTDYLSSETNNRIRFDYLLQVKKPSLRIGDVGIDLGHHDLACGLYKSVRINNRTRWQHINGTGADPIIFRDIVFGNNVSLDTIWPAEPLNAQEMIKWCDAGQRFFSSFDAKVRHCNQELSDKLSTWNKLNHLDLSRIELANDIAWDRLFAAIGTMRQLTRFGFAYNHPIANLMDTHYEDSRRARDYYLKLATCIRQLTNLKKLDIQGLWLKSHAQLGSGCQDENSVSLEVANLIGINNQSREEIRNLIFNICSLAQLESLSIDGICSKGCSVWARCSTAYQHVVAVPFYFHIREWKKYEDQDFRSLISLSAENLAKMPSLQRISVYSPGGNCINRFSQAFREKLATARTAAQAAQVTARAARAAAERAAVERAAAREAARAARNAQPNVHSGWGLITNLFIPAIIDIPNILAANSAIPAANQDLPALTINAEVLQ